MIKELFLCVAFVVSTLGFVKAQQSNLVVFSDTDQSFSLLLNGKRVNQLPNQNLKVTGLYPGWYNLRLVFTNPNIPQMETGLAFEPGREVTYAVVRDAAGKHTLIFVNEYTLGYSPFPRGHQFVVGYDGPVNADEVPIISTTQTTTTITTTDPNMVFTYPIDPVLPPDPLSGYSGEMGCQNVMDEQAFSEARSSISSKSFSSSKMAVAKQITRSGCLLSRQVREIMKLFDYETDRLNYAKFAYDYTYDQGNYYKVNDAFEFESSIRSLEEFLYSR